MELNAAEIEMNTIPHVSKKKKKEREKERPSPQRNRRRRARILLVRRNLKRPSICGITWNFTFFSRCCHLGLSRLVTFNGYLSASHVHLVTSLQSLDLQYHQFEGRLNQHFLKIWLQACLAILFWVVKLLAVLTMVLPRFTYKL